MGDGLFSKLKVLVGIEEIEDDDDDYEIEEKKTPPASEKKYLESSSSLAPVGNRVENRNVIVNNDIRAGGASVVNKMGGNTSQFKMVVIEPEGFKDSEKLVDNLKAKKPIIINLEKLDSDVARKIFDFLSGATFALDGHVQKVANNIFLFTPANVDVGTSISSKGGDFSSGKSPWK